MHELSVAQMAQGLAAGAFSSLELTQHFLRRIEAHNGHLNAYISVCAEQALASARRADAAIAAGQQGPLTGVPLAHKDIFCTAGVRTTCGSRMLAEFVPPYDATVVARLQAAGAVVLGKTNMDEFAMGSSNETSYFSAVRNPWDTDCVPGGSSGGSAAAVAARLAPIATATDTGGSIRQPAALCGVTGLKPTYGRVSRWGMIAFASSMDQGGPIGQSAEDCALLLQAMAGHDPKDSTSIVEPVPDYCGQFGGPLDGLKIGVVEEYFADLGDAVAARVRGALAELEKLGTRLVSVRLPRSHLAVPAYYVLAPAEASANLARFDGVRYGYRCAEPVDLLDLYCRTRAEGFGAEVKRRILVGTYVLSAGFYDAYFRKAQQVRRLIKEDFAAAFAQVDILAGPSCPAGAFRFGSKTADPVAMYLQDIYTIAANLAGLPALSLPCGAVAGKPIGLQLIGNYFAEARILGAAHRLQQATDWHRAVPAAEGWR
ncbi:MAG: Asp-tRNA(Asn)/Glu-tRNA(Gln) amidotransferase subunit GatA [Cellvibrionales bacterium]|nr:Asp-tRNA(Asn)/Glu-tRNA(Gln) amidotransferase subunit GatA [Cellvibrionales bacterium]